MDFWIVKLSDIGIIWFGICDIFWGFYFIYDVFENFKEKFKKELFDLKKKDYNFLKW